MVEENKYCNPFVIFITFLFVRMKPFVPTIGFTELMDSLDQSVIYQPVDDIVNKKTNKRKKGKQ